MGFLHEMAPGKNSLAYDLQELFRFLIDLAVLNLIERDAMDAMDAQDFIRTEKYSLRCTVHSPKGQIFFEKISDFRGGG